RPQPRAAPRGPRAGGDEDPIAAQPPPVIELEAVVVPVPPGGGRVDPKGELDALRLEGLAESFAEGLGLAGQHVLRAVEEHRLAAEPQHHPSELHPGGPPADPEDAPRPPGPPPPLPPPPAPH